jgi:hypothetical protein
MIKSGEGEQRFRMYVFSDGREHVIETDRRGVKDQSIIYQQTKPPSFLEKHEGEWSFAKENGGVRVHLVHKVSINEAKAKEVLGVSNLAEAESIIRSALSRNAMTTMQAVKAQVENGS